ncbi:MAG TPA: hypothetical protein VM118_07270 [Acidobacteriota bacterium]|nr:hypothetical protein [Acidobacteriota bacterium]
MPYGASAAGAAAAIARAIKASGAIVKLEPRDFLTILGRARTPVVVSAKGGFFGRKHRYLTSYKGLFFFAETSEPLALPGDIELIVSKKIWIPG